MSDKDKWKWKTQPCKECLLKKSCKQECFKWPAYRVVSEYIRENDLQNICISCGNENVDYYDNVQWDCENCKSGRSRIYIGYIDRFE